MRRLPEAEQAASDRAEWLGIIVATLQQHAPSREEAITQNQLIGLLPAGSRLTDSRRACQDAATSPLTPVRSCPGPNRSLLYWYETAGEAGWGPVSPPHPDSQTPGTHPSVSPGGSHSIGTHPSASPAGLTPSPAPEVLEVAPAADLSDSPERPPARADLRAGFERYVAESRGGMWAKLDAERDGPVS